MKQLRNFKLIVLAILLCTNNLFGQILCGTSGEPPTFISGADCNGTGTYPKNGSYSYPYDATDFKPASNTVIKNIKLKFIIVQNPSKPYLGNFSNTLEYNKYFNDMVSWMNYLYANISNDPSCSLPVPNDMRIQFEYVLSYYSDATGIYWDNPSTSWPYNNECPTGSNWDLDPLLSETDKYINVFFTEDGAFFDEIVSGIGSSNYNSIACSEFPSFIDMSQISRVNMRSLFTQYYDKKHTTLWPSTYWDDTELTYHSNNRYWWAITSDAAGLGHELGHSLDLKHIELCNDTYIMDPVSSTRIYFNEDEMGKANSALYISSVRKYVKDCPIDEINNIVITGDEIWEYDIELYSDLILESGSSLTIKCKANMPTDARIIIERGAKLIVDGGTITKSCDGLWQGIEVWGNSSYTAHPTKTDIVTGAYPSSAAHHGVVWIKNGGTIEFARNAITTSKYDDYTNQNYYGGIVLAESCTFRNNKRSAEFMKYDYYPYDADDDNISEFKNCTFIIDDDYPATETFAYHLSLWDVDGLTFTDNVYKDLRTGSTGASEGIYSIDASYMVNSMLCSPPPPNTCTGDYNYFEGFMRGIHAANANYRPLNIKINTGIFEDNTRGILLSNVKNSVVINNTFRIQDNTVNSYGLYLEDCENYQVENNYFTSLAGFDGGAPFNAGIYAANNSNANTLIYRNIFEGLETGIRCQVNNKNLQIKCNTFLSEINRYHVYATSGLLGNQGKCLSNMFDPDERVQAPAGNIFSHDCIYTEGDFKIHTGITELKYRHHDDPAYSPQCFTTPNIILNNCMIDPDEGGYVACPSTLPGSGEALVAGGGSSASQLLAEYYATEEIISGLEELMAAAEIETEENGDLTYFTAIQEQLSNSIVSSYITELKPDSAIWFLEQQETDKAKETIVQIYQMTEEFTAAETALKNVNTATIEGADFVTLYEVLIPVAAEGRTILQLGKKEISIIESLAGKQSPSGVAAENILQFINQTDYPEVFDAELPEDLRLLQQENSISAIQIFPNPADNILHISIASNEDEIKYVFIAYSLNGQKIYESSLDKANTAINISKWSKGIYLCEVWADGIIVFTEKLVKE